VWPQCERRVADQAGPPEGHPRHLEVDDHLDERLGGSSDEFGERCRKFGVRGRTQLL
jgi:hypothetical protein